MRFAKALVTGALCDFALPVRQLPWQVAAGMAIIFFGLVGFARLSRHWRTPLPDQVFLKLVPTADQQHHPMPGYEQLVPSGDHARR